MEDGPVALPGRHKQVSVVSLVVVPCIIGLLTFAVTFGARFLADGLHTSVSRASSEAIGFTVVTMLASLAMGVWWDAASGKMLRSSTGSSGRDLSGAATADGVLPDVPVSGVSFSNGFRTHVLAVIRGLLRGRDRVPLRAVLRRRLAPYALLLLACWTPWYLFCWPGVMRDDTIAQFMQSSGYHEFYTQHPLFDTLVFGLFWRLGGVLGSLAWGLAIYVGVQMVLMAANLVLVLCWLRSRGLPRLAEAAGLLYSAVFYGVVGGAVTMSKDSLNTVFLVPLAVIIAEVCLTRGRALADHRLCVALVALAFLAVASKRTMLVVVLLAGVAMVLACSSHRRRAICCLLGAVLLAQGVWAPMVTVSTHAHVSLDRDVFGVIMLPVARIQAEEPQDITASDRAELRAFMNVDQAGSRYDDERSDATSWTVRPQDALPAKLRALKAWVVIGLNHPRAYVRTYATLDSRWYYPSGDGAIMFPWSSRYLFDAGYMRRWDTFVTRPVTAQSALGDLVDATATVPAWKKAVAKRLRRIIRRPAFSYAVWVTFLPMLAGLYLLVRRRWMALAAWSLVGFTVLSLYASPVVLCWYATPMFQLLPLVMGLGFVGVEGCGISEDAGMRLHQIAKSA